MHRRFISRAAIVLAAVALIAGGLIGGFYITVIEHFDVPAPKADYPKPQNLLEAQKQDLDYFGKLVATDRSYTIEGRDRARTKFAQLKQLNSPLHPARLKVRLMQMLAMADNGHSSMFDGDSSSNPLNACQANPGHFLLGWFLRHARRKALRCALGWTSDADRRGAFR